MIESSRFGGPLRCLTQAVSLLASLFVLSGMPSTGAAEEPPCYECHDELPAVSQPHDPVDGGECDSCHEDHGDAEELRLIEEGSALCFQCHDEMTGESVHPPVEDGECTACHNPHGSDNASLLTVPAEEICMECHDAPEGEVIHAAVDDGCTTCHVPHSSEHGSLLTADPGEICLECHDNPGQNDDGEEWGTLHAALEDGCTACHNPHASDHGSLLLQEAAPLCGECHDDKNADDSGEAWSTPHPPVEEGECTSCHLPHGSANEALLTVAGAELCSECHDDMNADQNGNAWKSPHSPVEEGECTGCHFVHGSAHASLLMDEPPELCNECHDDKRLNEDGDAWRIEHPPVAEGACLDCHVAHGSNATGVLRKAVIDVCYECHTDPHSNHLEHDEESTKVRVPVDFPMKADGSFICTGCHLPHGAFENSLWKGTQATFCSICHLY